MTGVPPWSRLRAAGLVTLIVAVVTEMIAAVVNADPLALLGCLVTACLGLVLAVDGVRRLDEWKKK